MMTFPYMKWKIKNVWNHQPATLVCWFLNIEKAFSRSLLDMLCLSCDVDLWKNDIGDNKNHDETVSWMHHEHLKDSKHSDHVDEMLNWLVSFRTSQEKKTNHPLSIRFEGRTIRELLTSGSKCFNIHPTSTGIKSQHGIGHKQYYLKGTWWDATSQVNDHPDGNNGTTEAHLRRHGNFQINAQRLQLVLGEPWRLLNGIYLFIHL